MSKVEIDDKRSPIGVRATVAGLLSFGILVVLGLNIITVVAAPIGVVILVVGQTVERQGADRTVIVQRRERTPIIMWSSAGFFAVAAIGALLTAQFLWLLLFLVATGATGALAYFYGGGRWPWEGQEPETFSEATPEDWAVRNATEHIFDQTGLFIKSTTTGLPVYPDIIKRGKDAQGRIYFDFRVLSGHQTVEDVAKKSGHIASAWNVPRVIVSEPEPHIARCTAVIHETKLTGPVEWKPRKVSGSVVDYVRSLPMGAYIEDGQEFRLDLKERNFVIGGLPGSGKSSFTNALLAHLSRHPDVRFAFVDLKDGVEAAPWEARADQIIESDDDDDDDDDDIDGALDALDDLSAPSSGQENLKRFLAGVMIDMKRRYKRMKRAGVTNAWSEGFLGADEPLKVIVIDEASDAFLTDSKERAKMTDTIITALKQVIQKGRAAGYVMLLATQFPKEENLPNTIRANVSDAIAFRCRDSRGVSAIFGADYVPDSKATDPVAMGDRDRGQAVVVGEDGAARRVQMAWLSKDAKAKVVSSSSPLKRDWLDAGPLPAATVQKKEPASAPASEQDELDELMKGLDLS